MRTWHVDNFHPLFFSFPFFFFFILSLLPTISPSLMASTCRRPSGSSLIASVVLGDQGPLRDSVPTWPPAQAPPNYGSPARRRERRGASSSRLANSGAFPNVLIAPVASHNCLGPDPSFHCRWFARFLTKLVHLFLSWFKSE